MKATMRATNLDRVLEIAEAIAPDTSVFDSSIGIDDNCFSAEKLVQVLHQGASGEDAAHIVSCSTCAENARGLQAVSLNSKRDFVAEALGKHASRSANVIRDEFVAAILALPEKMIQIPAASEGSLAFECNLFPVNCNLEDIDLTTIQASGAIISESEAVAQLLDVNRDGTADCIRVAFAKGRLAARVQDAIKHHQTVIDTVQIAGDILCQNTRKRIVGQARLEFSDPADLARG